MNHYPSKILLIGEYAVLAGSPFLAIPYDGYESVWTTSDQVDPYLPSILAYLKNENFEFLNLTKLIEDVSNGVSLTSTIPIGYGVGSSGSVTAAIYDRYANDAVEDLSTLKSRMAAIESFFHGQSSGLDPLVSYLKKPIGSVEGEITILPEIKLNKNWFLINTGIARSTEKLIAIYNDKLKSSDFEKSIHKLIDINNTLFNHVYKNNECGLVDSMRAISELQLAQFGEMIPEHIAEIWKMGLISNSYYLKLCGAGGGGFFLGYDVDGSIASSNHNLVWL